MDISHSKAEKKITDEMLDGFAIGRIRDDGLSRLEEYSSLVVDVVVPAPSITPVPAYTSNLIETPGSAIN